MRETAALARWMASQSARQCGPCVHGLDALAGEIAAVAEGYGGEATERRIRRLASLTARRGACAHPDGAVKALLSALDAFPDEFAQHAHAGACEACAAPPVLPLPAWQLPGTAAADPCRMSRHVRVNPIACEAHGMCAELLPERITLDEWGYPIVDERAAGRRARRACAARGEGLPRTRGVDRGTRGARLASASGGGDQRVDGDLHRPRGDDPSDFERLRLPRLQGAGAPRRGEGVTAGAAALQQPDGGGADHEAARRGGDRRPCGQRPDTRREGPLARQDGYSVDLLVALSVAERCRVLVHRRQSVKARGDY